MTRFTEQERTVVRHAKRAAQPTGLFSALRSLTRPFQRALRRRRTIADLSRLDDRLLQDIGISRGEIEHVASGLAAVAADGKSNGLLRRVASAFRRARARAAAVRELAALDDRLLADIGLQRGRIVEAVDQAMQPDLTRRGATQYPRHTVVGDLVTQLNHGVVSRARVWNRSRIAAGQMARLDRETLHDLGYVKGDVDWVPDFLANRLLRSANRNSPVKVA